MSSTIESSRHQEVVLAEPRGPILAKVILGEDSHAEGGEDGTVDADREVAKGPAENGSNDLVCAELGESLVNEPERERDSESDQDTEWHNLRAVQLHPAKNG